MIISTNTCKYAVIIVNMLVIVVLPTHYFVVEMSE